MRFRLLRDFFGRRSDKPAPLARAEGVIYDPAGASAWAGYSEDDDLAALAIEDVGWIPVGGGGAQAMLGGRINDRPSLLAKCAALYYQDPIARNIVNTYTFFLLGEGFTVSFGNDAKDAEFAAWAEENEWEERVETAVRTTCLLGEAFLLMQPWRTLAGVGHDGPTSGPTEAVSGEVTQLEAKSFRVLDPFRLSAIKVNPQDADDVWGYGLAGDGGRVTWIDPRDVVQIRFDRMGGVVHGVPILMPAIVPLTQLGKFAENRYYLNWIRSRFPAIRKITGGTTSVAEEKTRTTYASLPKPGTVVFEKGPVEWQFPSLNIGASDVWDDWRTIVLRIAAAVSLPEYLVVMDASNSNFSSTLVAESPVHHLFRSLQRSIACALEAAVERFFPGSDVEVVPSPVVPRELDKKAMAVSAMLDRGVMSKRTAAGEMGLEWDGPDGERMRLEKERAEGMLAMPPMGPEPQAMAGRFAPAAKNGNGEGEPPQE